MKIGLFFGSFNPVHNGHLIIADYIAQETLVEQIWFVPSPHNPLKDKKTLLAFHQRVELLQLCLADTPYLKICTIEDKLPRPSYTIDTLQALQKQYPQHTFSLIIGEDNLSTLPKWKSFETLIANYSWIVFPRINTPISLLHDYHTVQLLKEAPIIQLSSTYIRQKIQENREVSFMMHPSAYQYMKEMNFYKKNKK